MSYQMIPIKDLEVDSLNVRKDVGDIGELEDSIEKEGILQNLVVREKGTQLYVVVGQRRFHAAKSVGLKEVPAIVKELTDEEALALSLTENLQRGDLGLDEEADGIAKLYEMCGSARKTGEAIGKSKTWIQQRLSAKGIIDTFKKKTVPHEGHSIPRDAQKVSDIAGTAKSVYPDEEQKQAEFFGALKDKPRKEVHRATTYVRAKKEMEPEVFAKKPVKEIVEDAFKVINVDVKLRFDSNISKAIIKVADERGISWEDVVEIAVEQWLREGGHLG